METLYFQIKIKRPAPNSRAFYYILRVIFYARYLLNSLSSEFFISVASSRVEAVDV